MHLKKYYNIAWRILCVKKEGTTGLLSSGIFKLLHLLFYLDVWKELDIIPLTFFSLHISLAITKAFNSKRQDCQFLVQNFSLFFLSWKAVIYTRE